MEAFDQREHARRLADETERKRRLAAIARDTSKTLEERVDAVLNGARLRRLLWTIGTAEGGAVVFPTDGKHALANKAALAELLEILPKVGLRGTLDGQRLVVARAPSQDSATPPPPSWPRALLAADREYQRLRRVALDAFGELAGVLGPEVQRIAGPLEPALQRELAGLARDLSWAAHHPSEGRLVGVAAMCAQRARDVAASTAREALAVTAWRAAEACVDLARFAEAWALRQRRGGT
jgi:hypothetical protein